MAARRAAPAPQPLEHRILQTATLCLLAAGAVMVYSASSARTLLQGQGDGSGYLVKYAIYGAVGLVAMQLLARTGLDAVRRVTGPLLVTAFVLLLAVKVPHIGIEVNGARRWLGAGPLQFQPSELMKLALLLYAVRVLADKPKRVRSVRAIVNPLGVVVGAALLLVASHPALGPALVTAFPMPAVLVAAGVPLRFLAIGAGAAILVIGLFAIAEPYRRARLTTFVDPWAHANGAGFQAVQGQIAIGSGGLTGRGLGASIEKVFFLPEAHTDFILAVIGEELGVIGVWALLFLYGLVGYGGLQAAPPARGAHPAPLAPRPTPPIPSPAPLHRLPLLRPAPPARGAPPVLSRRPPRPR